MHTLIITHDLANAGIRQDVNAALATFGNVIKLTECSFAMATEMPVDAIFEVLSKYIDSSDKLYVIKLSEPYEGQGPNEISDWFSEHFV